MFEKILVVVDSMAEEQNELERALALASHFDSKLHLVDSVKDLSITIRYLSRDYAHIHELLLKEKREALAELIKRCQAHDIKATGEVLEGPSSKVTAMAAKNFGADLILRRAKGEHSHTRGPIGSSAQRLLRDLPCTLWLNQPSANPNCEKIIAAVDATPDDDAHADLNRRIMDIAVELAKHQRCKLLVTYVWQLYGAEMLKNRIPESEYELLKKDNYEKHVQSFEELLQHYDLHAMGPEARLLEGEPSLLVPELCERENSCLLICGTIARRGISGLLIGNTSERIIQRTKSSVLAVKPDAVTSTA